MCFKVQSPIVTPARQPTVEELVAAASVGMTDGEKAQYWWELTQQLFALLGKIDITVSQIPAADFVAIARATYPTLTDFKTADGIYYITTLESMQQVLSRDWSNLVKYQADVSDCDKFANRLFDHLCLNYGLNSVVPVWGDTTGGYHGFNLAVVLIDGILGAKLIEPQSDAIFDLKGPMGVYTPQTVAVELGIVGKGEG